MRPITIGFSGCLFGLASTKMKCRLHGSQPDVTVMCDETFSQNMKKSSNDIGRFFHVLPGVSESQASQHALPKDSTLSPECVNRHRKQHRNEFDGSEAQKTLVAMHMQEGGLLRFQAEKRRDNRFTAMLFDKFGGRKALQKVIRSGHLVQIRLGHTHRSLAFRPSKVHEIPPRRPRYKDNTERSAKEKNSRRRAMYYGNMAGQLREAGVSTAVRQALVCRRIARIMMHRQEKFLMGQPSSYTTCRWPQQHLRDKGVKLPAVQWRENGRKKSRRCPNRQADGCGNKCKKIAT